MLLHGCPTRMAFEWKVPSGCWKNDDSKSQEPTATQLLMEVQGMWKAMLKAHQGAGMPKSDAENQKSIQREVKQVHQWSSMASVSAVPGLYACGAFQ